VLDHSQATPADQDARAEPAAPPQASPARRAGVVLRAHWLAAVLLGAGLVLRVLAELAYRPALFYIDSPRYLYDAQGMDPVGYKAPLRAILAVGNLDTVTGVQHLLGLAMALVIYLLLLRRGVSRWLAALAMAPVLLDAYQLQSEQSIMPGTWFEALIVAGLAILLWRPGAGWRRLLAAGVLLGASATMAQVGEALLLPAAGYVLVAVLAAAGGWRQAITKALAMGAAFALPIVAYMAGSDALTGAFALSHTGVTSFYGRMAAAADCATLKLPAAERGLCPTRAQQAQGPDWLEYNAGSPVRAYYDNPDRARTDGQLSSFNHAVLTQQPLRVLRAYGRDVLKLYAVTRTTDPGDTPVWRWWFRTYYRYFPPHASQAQVDQAIQRWGGGKPAVWTPVASFLRAYQLDGGYTPGPLLALFTVTGLAGSLTLLRRRLDPARRQRALACLLFFASAAGLLLVSDMFEFSWRYQIPAVVTLVPAGVLGLSVLLSRRPSSA
jgi:hypothetical protein